MTSSPLIDGSSIIATFNRTHQICFGRSAEVSRRPDTPNSLPEICSGLNTRSKEGRVAGAKPAVVIEELGDNEEDPFGYSLNGNQKV